ncbi:MAG: hypothetical protein HZA54_16755 [Planctomycetes bacterium]|nr:hypothetical protein [Planctomycetota bacterium]
MHAPAAAAAAPAAPSPARKEVSIKASFHDGAKLAAEDGNFDAHVGGRLITQSRWFLQSSRANDSFFVREARIQVDGSFWKDYEYKVQFDLGKGAAQLRDGYVGWKRYPWLTLRVGHLTRFQIDF